jgi:hypothetical protein
VWKNPIFSHVHFVVRLAHKKLCRGIEKMLRQGFLVGDDLVV